MSAARNDAVAGLRDTITALQRQLDEQGAERDAALAREAALAEVLGVINRSPGDPAPVFEKILEAATRLCEAAFGELWGTDLGGPVALLNVPPAYAAYRARRDYTPSPGSIGGRIGAGEHVVHIADLVDDDIYRNGDAGRRAMVDLGRARSAAAIALVKDDAVHGVIVVYRQEVRPFTDRQIALLQNFAAQAVIAMENARLLDELRQRTGDLQESLEYQTATSDVLKVISRSAFDLGTVLKTVVTSAVNLCWAERAILYRYRDGLCHFEAGSNVSPEVELYEHANPISPGRDTVAGRAMLEGRTVQIVDALHDPDYGPKNAAQLDSVRSMLGVPLLRDGVLTGVFALARTVAEPFTDRQIELVTTFADQAVIAMENARLINEQREALEQQTATAEVLQVINASPGDLALVFDTMLEKAIRICDSPGGVFWFVDGDNIRRAASRGYPAPYEAFLNSLFRLGPNTFIRRLALGEDLVHVADLATSEIYISGDPLPRAAVDLAGIHTMAAVPLRRNGVLVGAFSVTRLEVRPFTDKQIALIESFAAQAVIAMENARLINEQREALEQQTATAEVLQVINASPGNLAPVFDAMLDKAMRLCGAAFGELHTFDGARYVPGVTKGVPAAYANYRRQNARTGQILPGSIFQRIHDGARVVHIPDLMAEDLYRQGNPGRLAMVNLGGARTSLSVPLRKDDAVLGLINVYRQEVRPFSDKQIALLENFAAQAVIAMENARLLTELRTRTDELAQRQAELRVTFENMGDGVAMFDETPRLVAWNRKFQEIFDVPDGLLDEHRTYADYIRFLGARGDYGPDTDPEDMIRRFIERAGQHYTTERTRPDGRVIEIRYNPVEGGGFVLIYADITERKRNEAAIAAARDAAEEASRTIEAAYRDLKTAQANLIQAEKMASLGQLTAGIAHEIKNPLNFVNNFAILSVELLDELKETAAPAFAMLDAGKRADIEDVTGMLTANLQKITEHGRRADGIVRSMLEHSRGESGERRKVDLNAVVEEALNLAYHGARAHDQSFNITLERDYAEGMSPIELNPQDVTRVFLNLFGNGFYAANKRARDNPPPGFEPTLKVTTRDLDDAVEIRVRDNGIGIPPEIIDKLFQPFFTTKPTGEGTGLGLSISYDVVTQQHGGTIAVDSRVGEYTEFTIRLPRQR